MFISEQRRVHTPEHSFERSVNSSCLLLNMAFSKCHDSSVSLVNSSGDFALVLKTWTSFFQLMVLNLDVSM